MELTPELQEKKVFLIEGLKRTYKKQYDAIQPLPYIKDRLYCVDKVFVEGGVEVCLAPELTRGIGGSWERLESYKSIYTDFRFISKRRIIQGEPGYGKSTLTLQLAYDWCNGVWNSSLRNVDILILLRLRQLGSVKSLFRAIKSFLLFHEPRVSMHEIEKIIRSSSVHITLDGYDEYPGRGSNDNDDVHRIIKMELFADFDVSLTTRYLPESLRKETKRAKLTGFDDKARDEYIRKAVVGNNDEAVEKIKQRLYENSILADLCQVPLIFVMFAHMAHDQRDFMKFKSVTQFFKHIIRCFYDHLNRKRKLNDSRNNRFYLLEMEHHELDKIAFEGLNKKNQQLSWIKTEFRERVRPESYHQYILIGILVEEDVVSDDSTVDNVLFTTEVRFYHKLFCEWYAAHHLVTLVKNAYDINQTLRFLDPFDLQYLFRFACGLDPDAGKILINHLKRLPGGDTFAILCILEQTGDVNDIMDAVKDLCSRDVKIKRGDSALLQRSTTQLLEIASKNDVPISCLHLDYSSIKFEGDTMVLHSGISLPKLPTVEKIHIAGSNEQYDNTGTVTDNNILNLFRYGMKCGRIKELMFSQLQLPTSILLEAFTDIMKTRNIQVRWRPFDIDFHLDLQIGHWEVVDIQVLENIRCSTVSIDSENKLQQRSTVQLLHVAHRHNIPISSLLFSESFKMTDNGAIILNTGIRVTNLPPLQKIHDVDNIDSNAITEQDIANILKCVMKGQHFNKLCFEGWLMPVSLSSAFMNWMLSLGLNVLWRPFDNNFRPDLQTGHWEVVDNQVMEHIRDSTVSIDGKHSVLQQRSTVQLLHVAHRYNIPISSLLFNESFKTTDNGTITLNNGIQLTNLPPLQKIHVVDKNERNTSEITERDIINILLCAMEDQHFNVLCFEGCRLPVSVSSSSFTKTMISRAIKVSWCPFDSVFHLDLQTGLWEVDDFEAIRDSFSHTFSINDSDTGLQHRSKVQLLYIAANHDTPISCVHVNKCVEHYGEDEFLLQSQVLLAPLTTVQHICIEERMGTKEMRKIRNTDMERIFHFGMKCQQLQDISFRSCILSLDNISNYIPSEMKEGDLRVTWPEGGYHLNLQTGDWEVADLDPIRELCTKTVRINCVDSQPLQRDTIRLLENAAKYDIPIPCLYLKKSFKSIDAGIIILHSGLRLSCPVSVKKVVIDTEKGREMTETEVVDILMFVQQSHMLEELAFEGCRLPVSVSSSSFTKTMISRTINVSWCPFDSVFHLDLQTGLWEVDDFEAIRDSFSHTFSITDSDTGLQQRSKVQLLYIAANHNTPISCVHVNKCVERYEEESFLLQSGVRLEPVTTVQHICIEKGMGTKKMRKIGKTDMERIFHFGMKCQQLKDISFRSCMLPVDNLSNYIPSEMKGRDLRVTWPEGGYHLNLQNGNWEVADLDPIRAQCTKTVQINFRDSEALQRDTIRLLENAAKHDIPIPCLYLKKSFKSIDAGIIILHSGLRLSCPVSVKKVLIHTEEGREMTKTEVVDILKFVQQSHMLEELQFDGCLLPLTFSSESIPAELQSRMIKVSWSNYGYSLDLQSGFWKVNEVDVVKKLCTQIVHIQREESELLQRCTIQLLENASTSNIPISCLNLEGSFSNAGDVILNSGLRLSCPATVKKVVINTLYEGREMRNTDVIDILMFVQQSHMLEELEFHCCLLPQSIPAESIPSILKSRNVKVSWKPDFSPWYRYTLNLQSGRWVDRGSMQEIRDTEYNDKVREFQKKWRYTKWQKARVASEKK